MKRRCSLTAVVEREGDGYVALCPELDVASQGDTVEEATANLKEAVELFLECASSKEIRERLHEEVYVTRFEAAYAWTFAG
jgi:predicted RNase H-like HicB family nuclease